MSACLLARAKLAQYVADLRQSSLAEKGSTLVKAGFLTSPTSTIRNVTGNALMGGLDQLVTKPTAAGIDAILAVGKALTTDRGPGSIRERIARNRSITNTANVRGLRAVARGAAEGAREAVQTMRTGVDVARVGEKWDVERVHFDNPILQTYTQTVFNFMQSQDRPFWNAAFRASLEERARTLAIREGLKGADRDARINELLSTPTDEMSFGAIEDANYVTFKDQTALGTAASRFKTTLKGIGKPTVANPKGNPAIRATGQALYGLSELTLPFTQVPTSVAAKLIDYSPAGFARTLVSLLDPATRSQRGAVLGTARAIVGTAGAALGWALAKEGLMTGAAPTNPNERRQWELENKPANSIKIGGVWHSLQSGAPVTLMPLLGANLYQSAKANGASSLQQAATSPGTLAQTAGEEAKSLADQTFLTGAQSALEAVTDPERSAGRFVSDLATSVVPPVVSRVASGIDPTLRQTNGVGQRLQSKIPGASKHLPERLDAFGQPIRREGGMAGALLDPTSSRTAKDTPLLREMDRLGVTVGMPGRTLHIGRQAVQLTPEQYNAYLRVAGPLTQQALEALMNDPGYASATDDERASAMRLVIQHARDAARDQAKAEWARTHHDGP